MLRAADIVAAPGREVTDWKLDSAVFANLEQQLGTVDVDACADIWGLNAQVPAFWSKGDSCLLHDWRGKHVYANPPYDSVFITKLLAKAKRELQRDPAVRVTLVLPQWKTESWRSALADQFRCVDTFPKGKRLFTCPPGALDSSASRRDLGPTRWAVEVWHARGDGSSSS